MKRSSKRWQPAAAVAAVVVIGAAIAGAVFFGDDLWDDKARFAQPMELRGSWLGMNLRSVQGAKTVMPAVEGVMVADISERNGWRATQAGLRSGDVITAVDGTAVRDMADFYDITRKTDTSQPVILDVVRWNQRLSLVLPIGTPAGNQIVPSPMMPNQPVAVPAAGNPATRALFVCPSHGIGWPAQTVQPGYRCPICNGNLVRQQVQ